MKKKTVVLRGKTYSHLKDHGSKDKKAKGTKTCLLNRKFNFGNYKKLFRSNSNWK